MYCLEEALRCGWDKYCTVSDFELSLLLNATLHGVKKRSAESNR